MSSIDNRVVKMEFDNGDFEKNAKETQSTLDKIKDHLSGLGDKHKVGDIDTSSISDATKDVSSNVDTITEKFSAMELVVAGIFLNLGSKLADFAVDLTKSLTIEMPMEGYDKYENIVKNTAGMFHVAEYQGHTYEELQDILDEVTWYADATSYSLDAMTSAMLSAMNAGVDLGTVKDIVMGLGNSFSYAGATATEMQGAFAMWAKSLGGGQSLGNRQYFSLDTIYHVINPELKQRIIDTAEAMGRLRKEVDGTWTTIGGATNQIKGGMKVDMGSFQESLAAKWADGEVLAEVFGAYGRYADGVYKFRQQQYELTGELLTTSEAMEGYDKWLKETGQDLNEFGKKTFEAAMEAKMWSEVVDALKDAASSQWMRIFQAILGDYKQAKILFTELGDFLSGIFVDPVAALATEFETWAKNGGRDVLIEACKTLAGNISAIIAPIKNAFHDVFGSFNHETIMKLTNGFKKLAESLAISDQTSEALYSVSKALFSIVKLFFSILGGGLKIIGYIIGSVQPIIPFLMQLITVIAKTVQTVVDLINASTVIEMLTNSMAKAFKVIKTPIYDLSVTLGAATTGVEDFSSVLGDSGKLFDWVKEKIEKLVKVISDFIDLGMTEVIAPGLEKLNSYLKGTGNVTADAGTALDTLGNKADKATKSMKGFGEEVSSVGDIIAGKFKDGTKYCQDFMDSLDGVTFKEKFKSAFGIDKDQDIFFASPEEQTGDLIDRYRKQWGSSGTIFGQILDYIQKIMSIGLMNAVRKLINSFAVENIMKPAKAMNELIESFSKTMKQAQKSLKIHSVKVIAESIAIITAAMIALTFVDPEKLKVAAGYIFSSLIEICVAMAIVNGVCNNINSFQIAATIASLGVCMLLIASAMKIADGMEHPLQSFAIIGAILMLTGGLVQALDKFGSEYQLGEDAGKTFVKMGTALVLIAGAMAVMDTLEHPWQSLGVMALMLAAMTAVLVVLSRVQNKWQKVNFESFSGIAAAFIGMGTSLLMVAGVITLLGALPLGVVAQGGIVTAAIIGIMGLTIGLASRFGNPVGMIAFAAAFVILGIALVQFVGLITGLGLIPWDFIVDGVFKFITIMGALSTGLLLLTPAMPVLAMLILLATQLKGVFIGFGIACVGVSLAIAAFTAAFIALSTLGPVMMPAFIETCRLFLQGLVSMAPDFAAAIVAWIAAIIIAIEDSLDMIIEMIFDLIIIIFENVTEFVTSEKGKEFFKAVWEDLKIALKWLLDNIIPLLGTLLGKLFTFIKEHWRDGWEWLKKKFGELKEWIANWLREKWEALKTWIHNKKEALKNTIKDAIHGVIEGIEEKIEGIKNAIKNAAEALVNKFKSILGINSPSTVFHDFGLNILDGLKNGLSVTEKIEKLKSAVKNIGEAITGKIKSIFGFDDNGKSTKNSVFFGFGEQLMNGLDAGMNNGSAKVTKTTGDIADSMNKKFARMEGINSPSKVFEDFGLNICQGLSLGMVNNSDMVYDATTLVGDKATLAMAESMVNINDTVDGTLNTSPVITPVVDLSEVEAGVEAANAMMPEWIQVSRDREAREEEEKSAEPGWVKVSREREARELLEARKNNPFYDVTISHEAGPSGKSEYELLVEAAKKLGVVITDAMTDSELLIKMYAAKAGLDSTLVNNYDDYFNALNNQAISIATEKAVAKQTKLQEEIAAATAALKEMGVGKTTNVEFVQNNYSPEPLSKIAVYRQTHNQLSAFEEVFG